MAALHRRPRRRARHPRRRGFLFRRRLAQRKNRHRRRAAAGLRQPTLAELQSLPNVRLMSRTSVFGVYDDCYGAVERVSDHLPVPPALSCRARDFGDRRAGAPCWRRAPSTGLSSFGGNDRPGVMLAAAVQTYLNRFAVAPAKRMAFFANNDAAWTAAFQICGRGRRGRGDHRHAPRHRQRIFGRRAKTRHPDDRRRRDFRHVGQNARRHRRFRQGRTERLAVDGLAMSGGFSPNVHLTCHHGGRPVGTKTLPLLRRANVRPA